MNKNQFIVLFLTYIVIGIFNLLCNQYEQLPEHVKKVNLDIKGILRLLPSWPKLYVYFIYYGGISMIILFCLGLVGMFFFWSLAPWLWGGGYLGLMLFWPKAIWQVKGGWRMTFGSLMDFLTGTILALIFFGPAHALFFKN